MSVGLTGKKSTLVRVMAWGRQATSHCLSQCWPRSVIILHHNVLINKLSKWHVNNFKSLIAKETLIPLLVSSLYPFQWSWMGVYWICLVHLAYPSRLASCCGLFIIKDVHPSVHLSVVKFVWEFQFHVHVDCGHRQKPIDFQWCPFQNGWIAGHFEFLVWLWISTPNFNSTTLVYMGRSL